MESPKIISQLFVMPPGAQGVDHSPLAIGTCSDIEIVGAGNAGLYGEDAILIVCVSAEAIRAANTASL